MILNQDGGENMNILSKGYQPDKDTLDVNNPPQGGSGVPNKPAIKIEITDIDVASLLREAVRLLRDEYLECTEGEGCGRCDKVREFLRRADY